MSKSKTTKKTRVKVGNLRGQEKELKEQEADKIRGGGGVNGGVLGDKSNAGNFGIKVQ
jgi:hypothetical protein